MPTSLLQPTFPSAEVRQLRLSRHSVEAASDRLSGVVSSSPCRLSHGLSELAGRPVYLKLDCLQPTGSFKERGAAHALLSLSEDDQQRGIVAASAGNHGLGLALHGARLNVPVTVFMPASAPETKRQKCRRLGAQVISVGDTFDEARQAAEDYASRLDLAFVHPFDDPAVIAGQGTLTLEALAQVGLPRATLVLPAGGGGLLAGGALALEGTNWRLVGAEAASAPCLGAALAAGEPVPVPVRPGLADGLAVTQIGHLPFSIFSDRLDGYAAVDDYAIREAMLRLFETEHLIAEGAGATALAALLSGQIMAPAGEAVVLPICGSNIDAVAFAHALTTASRTAGR
jgi:threonine dehydratase